MQFNKRAALVSGALLCAVFCTFLLGVGQTQARYENVRSWKGIYAPEDPVLRSNFLAQGGQTVLLQDWDLSSSSYQTADIRLVTNGGTVSGTLQCQSDSQLITASLDTEDMTVSKTENYAMLTLTAANEAFDLAEETLVTIRVSWEQADAVTAWADFKVKLLPASAAPEAPENGGIEQQSNADMGITCPESFAVGELLYVNLALPQDADTVVLSYEGSGFPENTRYTVADEASFVLADEMAITVATVGQSELQLLLDFSWTAAVRDGFFISATAYKDGNEIAATNATVFLNPQPLGFELDTAGVIVGKDASVALPLTGDVNGLVCTLEHLVQKDGEVLYEASSDIIVRIVTQNAAAQIVMNNETSDAPAGTYRLTVSRVFDGVILTSFEIPIFVCY